MVSGVQTEAVGDASKTDTGVFLSQIHPSRKERRGAFIKGIDHLTDLCEEFQIWYNRWRPHMTLDGLRPDDVFYKNRPDKPGRAAKTVPGDIERHYFSSTRITGYRLRTVA